MKSILLSAAAFSIFSMPAFSQPLPNTAPLTMQGDLAAQMVESIDRYLVRETQIVASNREKYWHRDTSSPEAYAKSIEPNREHFRKMIGLVDQREAPHLEILSQLGNKDSAVAKGAGFKVYEVRWSVLKGVDGEGLLLLPDKAPVADIVALPDCDNSPEQLVGLSPGIPPESQFARRLAESGCRVLVPVLIDRGDKFTSTNPIRGTNLPHREFIQRAAYEMGRTMVGYEVQKVLAGVDWFVDSRKGAKTQRKVGVIGYGEGGLIAFYSAAADTRIDACCISGYFGPRENLWSEPIYRNVYGLLREFGDAEIACLVHSIELWTEYFPEIAGPPRTKGVSGAAPGSIKQDASQEFAEWTRFHKFGKFGAPIQTSHLGFTPHPRTLPPLINLLSPSAVYLGTGSVALLRHLTDPAVRLRRQYDQLVEHTQLLMRQSPLRRAEFWSKADASSVDKWKETSKAYRDRFWEDVIGKLPPGDIPANPRSRLVYDTPKYRGHEVVLNLYSDRPQDPTPNTQPPTQGVFAYGILLLPKDLKPGEKRPVVVCQHGLEGRPQDVADPKINNSAYNQYACKLAEQGFITFSPQNPYIGNDKFRVLLRKAQPLGLTLFSFIIRQHERILDWLSAQPFVDPDRIAFYGLSYGGKSAMRIPAVLEKYCLSICSADYNEWIWKNVEAHSPYSYLFTNEYDMPEWNLGNTFNYAEMSWLICPRPFMVERGHHDGVAPDEWVAYEFSKTRRRYDLLGIGDRTEIEFFNGPHTIHGVGTFAFLHKHLKWPEPKQ